MPDLDDLHLLAPDVDKAVAVRSFERRRDRLRRRRQAVMGSAAVLAAVALGVGSLALLSRDNGGEQSVIAGPPADTGAVAFDVLAVSSPSRQTTTFDVATDIESFRGLWDRSGSTDDRPELDLRRVVVVGITLPTGGCPPELVRIDRDGETLTPIFEHEPGATCGYPLVSSTFVIALDRAPLRPGFTLRLPADDIYGSAEQHLPVDLSGSTIAPETPALDPTAQEVCPPRIDAATRFVDGRLVAGFDTTVADLRGLAGERDEPGDTPAVMCWYEDATFVGARDLPASTTDALTVYIDGDIVHSGMTDGPVERP